MKTFKLAIISALVAGVLAGCSSGGDMSKSEVDALKTPTKSGPPPEAAKSMADGMANQLKENEAKGVDAQGIPLAKSTMGGNGAPKTNAPGVGGK